MTEPEQKNGWPRIVAAVLAGAAMVAFLFMGGRVIHLEWMAPLCWLAGPALLFFLLYRRGETAEPSATPWPLIILFLFGVLYLFSSTAEHKWFCFLNWLPTGRPFLFNLNCGAGRFVLLILLCWPLALIPLKRSGGFLALLLVATQFVALAALIGLLDGRMLYNDDHPSFMYRLWVISKSFPRMLSYSPAWNGGYVEYAPLTTGANAPGILLWPFWKWLPVAQFYPWGVGITYLVFVPVLAVLSIRIMRFGWVPAVIAGILSLSVSRYFYLWLFNYGTIGADFTCVFILPVAACLYRILIAGAPSVWTGVVLVLSVVFLLFWPVGLLMVLPIALAILVNARSWTLRKIGFLAASGFALFLLFLYPLIVILRTTDVAQNQWVEPAAAAVVDPWRVRLASGWDDLRWFTREVHPLILFLGIGGAFAGLDRRFRNWFVPIIVGFAVLAGWGKYIVPDLPLFRFSIPLFFVALLPAAVFTARILETADARLSVVRAAALALLAMTGWNTIQIYANRGPGGYAAAPAAVLEMADWIRTNTQPADRILLPGGTSHYYGGGHVAFLPVLFQREMLASEYRHDKQVDIRFGSPPDMPPKKLAALERYLELFAPHYALTLDPDWKAFFDANPSRFHKLREFDLGDPPVGVYRVLKPASLFERGGGIIKADVNVLDVKLDDPKAEAVIKYNWIEGLASDDAEIYPVDMGDGVRFIGIRPRGTRGVKIIFRRWI